MVPMGDALLDVLHSVLVIKRRRLPEANSRRSDRLWGLHVVTNADIGRRRHVKKPGTRQKTDIDKTLMRFTHDINARSVYEIGQRS